MYAGRRLWADYNQRHTPYTDVRVHVYMISFTLAVPQRPPGASNTCVVGNQDVARCVSKAGRDRVYFYRSAAPANTSICSPCINNNIAVPPSRTLVRAFRIRRKTRCGGGTPRRKSDGGKRKRKKNRTICGVGGCFREFPAVPEIRNGPCDPRRGSPPEKRATAFPLSCGARTALARPSGAGSKASRLRLRLFPSEPGPGGGRPFRY